jgi:hypothetical protein
MKIKEFYTRDHDSIAGYGGRIGYRYKTVVIVEFDPKVWNKAKRDRAIGGFVVDVGNALYRDHGFTQTYNPQIDTKARAKNGVTTVSFEYFHNSEPDALCMNYTGHHAGKPWVKPYEGDNGGSQYDLDPDVQATRRQEED